MTPREKDEQYFRLKRRIKRQDDHMVAYNALRRVRFRVQQLDPETREILQEEIDNALSLEWQHMLGAQQDIIEARRVLNP